MNRRNIKMEKKCGYKRADVWLYIQNRMGREEETEFQHHLLTCDDCKEELVRLRSVISSIQRKEKRKGTFRNWMIAASVACVVLGGGGYSYYYSSIRKDGHLLPEDVHQLKVNPPIIRGDMDSIAPQDSVRMDW